MPPQRSIQGYHELMGMNGKERAVVVKAYLAAADASKRLMDHDESLGTVPWRRPYKELESGTFPDSDEVAIFINGWIKQFYEPRPPNDRHGLI